MEKMEPELEPKLNNFCSATLVWHILPVELTVRVSHTVDSAMAISKNGSDYSSIGDG